MIFVPRHLTRAGQDRPDRANEPKPLDAHFQAAALVVLGDPGAGKTRLFEQAAKQEHGLCLDVRRFLRRPLQGLVHQPLYLDALDEVRARTEDGQGVLDQVIAKLEALGRPKFRLSCRAADWFGGLDERHLADASADRKVRVLQLCPLTESDAHAIVRAHGHDADEFLRQAHEQGFLDWLMNPRDIELLLEALTHGAWPQSRHELFERACRSLTLEPNPEHSHTPRAEVSTDSLLEAAGFLNACHLVSDSMGFSLQQQADREFPWLGDVVHPEIEGQALEAVVRRRLFENRGPKRVVPMHRSIAEYLAARFLVDRCRRGLPLKRILELITAPDDGVPSELRGLYAWLTCLTHERAELLLQRDPLAVVLYGDIAALGTSLRKRLLVELRAEAERDPYFRAGDSQQTPFAPFATPRLEPELRELLEDKRAPWRMTIAALDAVVSGEPLPGLGNLLLSLARDTSRVPVVAMRAVEAFCGICPDRPEDMQAILEDVHRGEIQDFGDRIRASVCKSLYPEVMSAAAIIRWIPRAKRNEVSLFAHFLDTAFLEKLPRDQLADLLDTLADWEPEPEKGDRSGYRRRKHDLGSFIARVLALGLEESGTTIDIPRLDRWLGVHLIRDHKFGKSILRADEATPIRQWLTDHPEIHRALYHHVFMEGSAEELREHRWNLDERCCRQEPPAVGHLLLGMAAEAADDDLARSLFSEALGVAQRSDGEPSLFEEIWRLTQDQPRFTETLGRSLSCRLGRVHESNAKDHRRQVEAKKEDEQNKAESSRWLRENLARLASGEATYALERLSYTYFNPSKEEDVEKLPAELRLAHLWGKEINEAALQGFIELALRPDGYDVRKLGEYSAKNKIPNWVYPILAGTELYWRLEPGAFRDLSRGVLATAVVCHFASYLPDHDRSMEWLDLAIKKHPEACAGAFLEFWLPALELKKEHVSGLERLADWPAIRRLTAPHLLETFPRVHPNVVWQLVAANLAEGRESEILKLASQQLRRPQGLRTEQFLLWLTVAFLLAPEIYGSKFETHASRSLGKGTAAKRAGLLKHWVERFASSDEKPMQGLPPSAISTIIIAFTKAYPHQPIVDDHEVDWRWEVPEYVRSLIDNLGARLDEKARATLTQLRDHSEMAPWRDHIRHTLLSQERERREQAFRRPSMADVVEVLRAGPPANAADLFALVGDHLEQIADDVRNGSSDGWRVFWNQESQWKVKEPLPEEICRDRLKERLGLELRPLGLAVERESDVAEHKRTDLRVLFGAYALPIECKRHGHGDLWTAIGDQLILKYTRDPASEGFGIYCVLWFGNDEMQLPSPPADIATPQTAADLADALRKTIPNGHEHRVKVVCIDVSRPSPDRSEGRAL